jgi:hypothetical protein
VATGENTYRTNAFYVLKLPTTASSRDIRRRAHELRLEAELSTDGREDLEEIRDAENVLLDAPRRLPEELLWICSPSEIVPPDISLDDRSAVQVALDSFSAPFGEGGVV